MSSFTSFEESVARFEINKVFFCVVFNVWSNKHVKNPAASAVMFSFSKWKVPEKSFAIGLGRLDSTYGRNSYTGWMGWGRMAMDGHGAGMTLSRVIPSALTTIIPSKGT